jgi:hypothetical protein
MKSAVIAQIALVTLCWILISGISHCQDTSISGSDKSFDVNVIKDSLELNEKVLERLYWHMRQHKNDNLRYYRDSNTEDEDREQQCLNFNKSIADSITSDSYMFIGKENGKHYVNINALDSMPDSTELGSKIINLESLCLSQIKGGDKLYVQLNHSLEEYNGAVKAFGRRCSRFIELCYHSCMGDTYANEADLTRIDLAIASIEVRRTEILDELTKLEIQQKLGENKGQILATKQNVAESKKAILDTLMSLPIPIELTHVVGFHAGIPSHLGFSYSWYVPNQSIFTYPYQLGLTGIVMLDVDSSSVAFGGQAGIMSQKFGARIGMLFNTNEAQESTGMFLSLLLREKRFVYSIDASRFFYGLSIGYAIGS